MHFLGQQGVADLKMQAVSIVAELLAKEEEGTVLYRALVALGTLVTGDAASMGLAKDLDVPSTLRRLNVASHEQAQATTAELLQLLA